MHARDSGIKMTQEITVAAASRKKTAVPAGKPGVHTSLGPALQHYQAAVQLVQQGKYDKAKAAFEKLLHVAPVEMLERCRMYVQTCDRQLERHDLQFASPAERFDYAIAQLNTGYYEEAREQLGLVLKDDPKADYAHYGLSVLASMTGHPQDCLDHLAAAVEMNPRNRLQARTDNDFQNMLDDPRFTEMLYPEIP